MLRFQCGQPKTEAYENGAEKKAPYTVISISIFGLFSRFNVDDRQKRQCGRKYFDTSVVGT